MFTRVVNFFKNKRLLQKRTIVENNGYAVSIIQRDHHNISRKNINSNALKVLHRLQKSHYEAYLVGGGVRDLLLEQHPKDFDIVTNATPEQIRHLFRNCRLVGRRFRLAHIMFGRDIIEVATFRASAPNQQKTSTTGMLLRDNVYGSIEEDALRRDFTINALYYNAADFTVRVYCNGLDDLNNRIIRLIGDPNTRYREDPIRMLRAIRFAAKLNMTIEKNTEAPMSQLSSLLKSVPAARLYDESLKIFLSGHSFNAYQLLRKNNMLTALFPSLEGKLTADGNSYTEKMTRTVFQNTDNRLNQDKIVNPAFLYAAVLWYPLVERAHQLTQESGLKYHEAFTMASSDILNEQCQATAIPRRVTSTLHDIWLLQRSLAKRTRQNALTLLSHPKFRAGFDLLELRAQNEKNELVALHAWWQEFQYADAEQQAVMLKSIASRTPYRSRSRSRPAHKRTKVSSEK